MNNPKPIPQLPAPTANLPIELESELKIRFQDCDPFGHLNNGAYINLFINAREDQLIDQYNFDIYDWSSATGSGWVVGKHEIVYRRPAHVHEKVKIKSRLMAFGERNLHVEMAMYNADGTELKAIMWTYFVHFSVPKKRTVPHVPELMQFFEAVLNPVSTPSIDARTHEIQTRLQAAATV
ncbi:MAG: acyl-CoA thioesterase [Bacteroidota bacterium]